MSAHREPDTVADYARNAQMRGLRVIIAGAGLSAALPGVVAAHTELPVIGVPLTSRSRWPAGSTRCCRSRRCRPGCRWPASAWTTRATRRCSPRASCSRDRPLHPPRARRGLDRRGAHGARGATSRSPPPRRSTGPPGPTSTRSARRPSRSRRWPGARAGHRPRRRRVRRRAGGVGRARRALDPLRADVLRRARHRARAAAAPRRGADPGGRARAGRGARARARASTRARCASGARTASTPSRPRSGSSSRASPSRRDRNAERLARAFDAGGDRRDLGRGRAPTPRSGPDYEARVLARLGLRAEPVSTQVVPRDRHAELLQAIALAGAGLERFATEIRHLQRTEVREVEEPFRAGQKGSSAMPHKRNPIITERISGLARVLRGYAQAAVEDVALWHERDISHSGRRARDPARRDDPARLHAAPGAARRRRHDRARRPHAGQPRGHVRRAVLPARAARARRGRHGARRRLPDRPAPRPARRGTTQTAAARRCSSASRASTLDLDAIFDYGHYVRHVPTILRAAGGDPMS